MSPPSARPISKPRPENHFYTFTDGKSHVKPEQNFGFAVAAADVICGAHRGQTGPGRTDPTTGYVRVFSGATGLLIYQLNGESARLAVLTRSR